MIDYDNQDPKKKISGKDITDQNMNGYASDINDKTTEITYQNDNDFDEAFKNLLRPIESITKTLLCEPLQYNLLKDLDSYLNHLRKIPNTDSSIFIEASLIIQNVSTIYPKRVDQYVEKMMIIVEKLRAYRTNLKEFTGRDAEIEQGTIRKTKGKNVKLYHSFGAVPLELGGQLKTFDCRLIDLSKKPCNPSIVTNFNIKVNNRLNKLLPYILIEGENIGKNHDFELNCDLNRDLAVSEENDFSTNEKNDTPLDCSNYQNNADPLLTYMDVDEVNYVDKFSVMLEPVIFGQTVNSVMVPYAAALPPENIINTIQVPQITDDDAWRTVVNDNAYSNKPIVNKRMSKRNDDRTWFPSYTLAECFQDFKINSVGADPEFIKIVYDAQTNQRSEIVKKQVKYIGDELELQEFENNDVDNNFNDIFENQEQLVEDYDGFQGFQKDAIDMQRHEQIQLECMDEQLEMKTRVDIWHNNLRPILEAEEKRTEFHIHEYQTRVLDCFEEIGEQKLFEDLAGGLEHEEVSRYFLSTLMMVNMHNVKISNVAGDPDGGIQIELMNKERHHELLQVNIGNQVNQDKK